MGLVITYETLFDLLRKEKSRDELQQLPVTFYPDVGAFMARKKAELEAGSGASRQRASIEYENVRKIMLELFERRERKLLLLALNVVRSENTIIDTELLLPLERQFFDSLVQQLQKTKEEVLGGLETASAEPVPVHNEPEPAQKEQKIESKKIEPEKQVKEDSEPKKPEINVDIEKKGPLNIKFLGDVPKFYGPEKQLFGPFKEGDKATLPDKIAQILIRKRRAEAM